MKRREFLKTFGIGIVGSGLTELVSGLYESSFGQDKTSNLVELNDQNFERLILEKDVALVNFGAKWCGPCREIKPLIERVAGKYKDEKRVIICYYDIGSWKRKEGENQSYQEKYNIEEVPSILVFEKGNFKGKMAYPLIWDAQNSRIVVESLLKGEEPMFYNENWNKYFPILESKNGK